MTSRTAIAELFLSELDPAEYSASAAIDVRAHRAELDSESGALTMTLAAPGEDMVGKVVAIVLTQADNGATVQFPQAGGNLTPSLSVLGETLVLIGADASRWAILALTKSAAAAAITQTYSTADATHAARTAAALTEGSGAIGGSQTGDITTLAVAWDGATDPTAAEGALLIDGIRECAAMINALRADQVDSAQLLNYVVDALQARGILS